MIIVFRPDTRIKSGGGHFFRCLNLAKVLKNKKNTIFFIIDKSNKNYRKILYKNKFSFSELPSNDKGNYEAKDLNNTRKILQKQKPNILIVDNYSLNKFWENNVKKDVEKIFVIDDFNRSHNCNIYLNQNVIKDKSIKKKLPKNTQVLSGLKYCIINSDLKKRLVKNPRKKLTKILIFMGMTDSTNITIKILKILNLSIFKKYNVKVIIGSNNSKSKKIKELSKKRKNTKFYSNINNMNEVINNSDLAISSGGTFLWECIYLGKPSLIITRSKRDLKNYKYLEKIKCLKILGKENNTDAKIKKNLQKSLLNIDNFDNNKISKVIDGYGSYRIKDKIFANS